MKIILLDGYSLNPGDLSYDVFKEFGVLSVYERTPNYKIAERIGNSEIVITDKAVIDENILLSCTNIKYIGILATGYDVVDINATRKRNIVVTNIPDYSTPTVSQHVFALLLEVCSHTGEHNRDVKSGQWANSPDFCFWNYPIIELFGKTMGIIGFGKIGQNTAKIANAFGMNVLFYSRSQKKELETEMCKMASLDEVLKKSDVITLHCPLSKDNKGMINKELISKMRDGAIIINTARGGLINEPDLKSALESGKIYYAACDVLSSEPPKDGNCLLDLKNTIITPHIAWAAKEARMRLLNIAVNNLKSFIEGKTINQIL